MQNPLTRLLGLAVLAIAAALPFTAFASAYAAVQTAASQAAMTPEQALNLLKQGNARFVAGTSINRDLLAQVEATAGGQYPHSVVLGCVDSRVPPEIVFDQGIGDIFSPRVAGNFADEELLGSMEFAAAVAGSKVIVVLGHTECGAVKGACDNVVLGNLTTTLSHIRPAVEAVSGVKGERNSSNKAFVDAVAHQNVHDNVKAIAEASEVLRKMIDDGQVIVVGAMYDVSTGVVTFLDS